MISAKTMLVRHVANPDHAFCLTTPVGRFSRGFRVANQHANPNLPEVNPKHTQQQPGYPPLADVEDWPLATQLQTNQQLKEANLLGGMLTYACLLESIPGKPLAVTGHFVFGNVQTVAPMAIYDTSR